eukprot:1067829-Prymnesium_polylepis.1
MPVLKPTTRVLSGPCCGSACSNCPSVPRKQRPMSRPRSTRCRWKTGSISGPTKTSSIVVPAT